MLSRTSSVISSFSAITTHAMHMPYNMYHCMGMWRHSVGEMCRNRRIIIGWEYKQNHQVLRRRIQTEWQHYWRWCAANNAQHPPSPKRTWLAEPKRSSAFLEALAFVGSKHKRICIWFQWGGEDRAFATTVRCQSNGRHCRNVFADAACHARQPKSTRSGWWWCDVA